MTRISIPMLQKVGGGISDDGKHIRLDLTAKSGERMQFALAGDDFTKFISFIIGLAAESAAKALQDKTERREVSANPILISEMGVGMGRTEDEALLTVRAGIFQMLFAVSLDTLIGTLILARARGREGGRRASRPSTLGPVRRNGRSG